jgi:hypothetical protein
MSLLKNIDLTHLLSLDAYKAVREERRQSLMQVKKQRRVSVGPDITFYFESYETILFQIQEMLYIEKGGESQLADELEAYAPLIPQGDELVATMMIEIPQPHRRKEVLSQLGHIEKSIHFLLGGESVVAHSLDDAIERTTPEGKTSAVHFLKFKFSKELIHQFQDPHSPVILDIHHPNYRHSTQLSPLVIQALSKDF